ncbi:MAG: discoidin domain-containing protein, partial [Flavobacteriaceae bacterium]|nr:discoidin domain-containing protein [Flavobacteriaceae bacterium]
MSVQFAAAQTPIFNSSMSISPLGSVSSPGGEQYYNIIDGNIYSKFLDFSAFDGFGFTVSIGAPKTATSISITTANDSPSRDPMNYQVLGSNDGSNFTSVATGSIACNGSRYYTRNFTFSNSTSYSYYRVNFTNTCGDSMFQLAEVQLYMPQCFPSLNSQPQATSVCVGNSATFSVSGSGIGLTYQWLKNNTAIVGATQSTFVVNNASVSNAGNYSCQLSASCGTITSNAVALTVNSMPNVSYAGVATNYPINAPIPNLTASNVGGNAVSNGIVTTTYASGFNYPNGVAVDGQGILYVTDTNNNQVLKIDSNGSSTAINYGFNGPFDVVADPSGIVYVANTYTNEILKVETNGTVSFFANGFSSPQGLGLDISGNVYVADMYNGRIVKLDSAGSVVQIWNGFYYPMDVAVTASGIIYVTEPYNSSVKKIDNFGNITSLYYPNYSYPQGIVTSPSGSVFVANTNNSEILEILPDDTVSVFSSFYYSPFGIAIDANGAFYISDQNSYDVKKLVETGFYAVAPSLPAGLNFNTETGLISGTPTQVTSSTTYVISSHNDCGVNNASINFATTNPCVFPVITNQPIAQTVCKNSTVTLSIAATGTGLTYQWNKAGTPISGQTNSSLSLSNVQVADAAIYTVTVTGDCGTVTSQDTTLTVNDVNTSGAVNYVSCYGGSDGSLEVFPSGGTAPYTYLWSNGVTTSLNAGIPSGWYTCLITDFIGCTYTYAFYITEPSPVATPTGVSIQTVSSGATLASLNVSGSNINWYAQPSSGTLLSSNTVIVGGTTYYASQTINGCESPVRLAVTVHIAAGALNYDGNNDIVQFGETLGNFGTGDFSIQLKVKTTLNRTYLLSKRSTCNNDNFLSINIGDGHVGVETSNINIPGSGLSFSGSAIINNGVWHQITLTRVSGTLTIYVDGVLDALVNPTTPQNASVDLNNNYNLQLGGFAPCTPYGGNAPFQGSFDEVRFWSRGLCIDEIQNNYNCEVQTTGNGLLANYHFNQGFEGENNASITSLLDSSGNGFTGVLSNFNLSGSQSNWTSDVAVTSGVSCGAVILNYATYYRDLDNDGFGDLNNTIVFCSQPFGYVTNSLDCNDNQLQYTDADGDGLGVLPLVACGVANNTDCNDSNPNAAPGDTLSTAIPVNSANYFTTGNTASCYTNTTGNQSPDLWYKVFLDPCATSLTVSTCSGTNYDSWIWIYAEDGSSYLAYNDDYCGLQSYLGNINITGHSFVYVVVEGWSNSTGTFGLNIVQNINPTITYYADADGDTYGDFNISQISCSGAPVGYVTNNLDCNDANAAIHPGAVDVCRDGIDNDCNGVIDNVGQPGGCVPV